MTSKKRLHHRTRRGAGPLEPRPVFQPVKQRTYGSAEAIVARAVDEAGGPKRVAEFFGISPTAVYNMTDPQYRGELSINRALRMARFMGAHAFAEAFAAAAGGLFLPAIASADEASLLVLGALSNTEMADLIGELLADVADGKITRRESGRLLAKIDVLLRTLCHARARVTALAGAGGGAA